MDLLKLAAEARGDADYEYNPTRYRSSCNNCSSSSGGGDGKLRLLDSIDLYVCMYVCSDDVQ